MSIEELNELVESGEIDEFVRVCEARQRKALSKIADDIVAKPNLRVILVAGPSSAGKTTTAKRLCTQLRVDERTALHCSTDDYFVGDARNPRDEIGVTDIPTIGLAERQEEIVLDDGRPNLVLPRDSQALFVCTRLRDEAHRFAITYHRKLREKALLGATEG